MAVHQLLLRGMLVGVLAGLVAFAFARVFSEPSIERAIAFESAHVHGHDHGDAHAHASDQANAHDPSQGAGPSADTSDEPELVSRAVQSSLGLVTGLVVYGGALGGLFALVFAVAYGRFAALSPKACAAVLALLCFVAVFAVPYLKYPANPPAVGAPETIGLRTGLYFSMVAISIVAMMVAFSLKRVVDGRLGSWNASLVGVVAFIALVGVAGFLLPTVNEVPETFPAATLWQFRLSSLGIQAILWSVIGLAFGVLTERSLKS